MHTEPTSALGIARHYLGDVVYGANDGIITTFAVVAGVTGGALSARAVLIVGAPCRCCLYLLPSAPADRFAMSVFLTLLILFGVGASRAIVTVQRWWNAGFEMLLLGVVVAAAAYGSGALVATLINGVH